MFANTKLLLPITLGLSMVSVTAYVLYYIFKKDEETETNVKTTQVNSIQVQVPKKIVPALIGRNGSNIKDIEKKTGAMIHFNKMTDQDYDICMIKGRLRATQLAEMAVYDFIKNQPVIEELYMPVPNWSAGRIIGYGGETINETSHISGAKIKVNGGFEGEGYKNRCVHIRGTKEQIAKAKEIIDSQVASEKCRRETDESMTLKPPEKTSDTDTGEKHAVVKKKTEPTISSIEVYVSAVCSPSRFWVQFVGPQVAQLDQLVEEMTEFYSTLEKCESQLQAYKFSEGKVVAAKFGHDGKWYRGRVMSVRDHEHVVHQRVVDIYYVDYGDSEYVNSDNIYDLRGDFLKLRFQAMECCLAGVVPIERVRTLTTTGELLEKWPEDAVKRFTKLAHVAKWKPLLSKTYAYTRLETPNSYNIYEVPAIKLFDKTEDGIVDIGAVLVQEGYGVFSNQSRASTPGPTSPPPPAYGDLSSSRVLGMPADGAADTSSASQSAEEQRASPEKQEEEIKQTGSLYSPDSSAVDDSVASSHMSEYSNIDSPKFIENGSKHIQSEEFILGEKQNNILETLMPESEFQNEIKANFNRIDSPHKIETMADDIEK